MIIKNLDGEVIFDGTDLRKADLRGADLRWADLEGADLEGVKLPIVKDFLDKNFEKSGRGYIVYKTFGTYYPSPDHWEIKPNSTLLSDVQEDRRELCGHGINFATIGWILNDHGNSRTIWKCKVYAKDVVVPLATDGKARASKLKILGKVDKL
jgi:hypothetical protein